MLVVDTAQGRWFLDGKTPLPKTSTSTRPKRSSLSATTSPATPKKHITKPCVILSTHHAIPAEIGKSANFRVEEGREYSYPTSESKITGRNW